MSLSPRQSRLVQSAAAVLVQELALTVPDAIQLIGASLRAELEERSVTLDILDVSSRAERASFVRGVVHRVQESLQARHEWSAATVKAAVESFMQMLHKSWDAERSE